MRIWALVPFLLLWRTPAIAAQEIVAIGDRVRVTALSYGLSARVGTVRSVANDRIEFRPADSTQSIELFFRGVSGFEKSVGKKASMIQGILYGAGAGVVVGGLAGTSCGRAFAGEGCPGKRLALGTLIGAAAGVLLGVAVLRTDRWVRVELPSGGRSLGLAGSVRF